MLGNLNVNLYVDYTANGKTCVTFLFFADFLRPLNAKMKRNGGNVPEMQLIVREFVDSDLSCKTY